MCYKFPGPRCSNHALKNYERAAKLYQDAKASNNQEEIDAACVKVIEARKIFDSTPAGQEYLRDTISRTKVPPLTKREKDSLLKRLELGQLLRESQEEAYRLAYPGRSKIAQALSGVLQTGFDLSDKSILNPFPPYKTKTATSDTTSSVKTKTEKTSVTAEKTAEEKVINKIKQGLNLQRGSADSEIDPEYTALSLSSSQDDLENLYTGGLCYQLALAMHDNDPKRFTLWEITSQSNEDGQIMEKAYSAHWFVKDEKRGVFIDAYGDHSSPESVLDGWPDFENDTSTKYIEHRDRAQAVGIMMRTWDDEVIPAFSPRWREEALGASTKLGLVV